MTQRKITIAIDGFSSSGKSTLARDLAEALNYTYLDSGAMYRAVTLYCINHNIDVHNAAQVEAALDHINLHIPPALSKTFAIHLNDRDVTDLIRSMEVSAVVSEIAAISAVRAFLVAQQQSAGKYGGIVMDGRDIGTVVFPNAELKIFVESDIETRIDRRHQELIKKGSNTSRLDVKQNLLHRDNIDSTRKDSPLLKASDAHTLNNTSLTRAQQLDAAIQLVHSITQ
jgi:cytidylate kinase